MKKILVLMFICVLAMPMFAAGKQDRPTGDSNQSEKASGTAAASAEVTALQTAYSLARYGYAEHSATALIGAAEILVEVQTQGLGTDPEKGQGSAREAKTQRPDYTPATLLADGRKYAEGDATILAWATKVETKMKTAGTRAAVGGPKQGVETVLARSTDRFRISFQAGKLAQVYVKGDGDTDLDLYVFDENGNRIAYDNDYGDECYVEWTPRWTGVFTIEVRNLGSVRNRYIILTN